MLTKKSFKFLKSNKSQINMSLSWVFMIIIGTFFVYFAYNVIDTYKDNQDLKYSYELKQNMRTILNQIGKTTDNDQIKFEYLGNLFLNSRVEILCNENTPLLSINDDIDPNNQFLRNYPAFMTPINENDVATTYLAVENFNFPFKITEMVAFVSTKNVIVLDEDFVLKNDILKKFNSGAYRNKVILQTEDFDNLNIEDFIKNSKNNGATSIIFVSSSNPTQNMKSYLDSIKNDNGIDNSINYLKVDYSNLNLNSGGLNSASSETKSRKIVLTYYNYKDSGDLANKQFSYYDYDGSLSLLTMAMFSSPEAFDCSYNLLINKIEPVYDFYIAKLDIINTKKQSEDLICSSSISEFEKKIHYDSLKNALNKGIDANNGFITAKNTMGDRFINSDVASSLLEQIDLSFKKLEEKSCVYVY